MVAFDTLKASQRLRKAGFPEDQSVALRKDFANEMAAQQSELANRMAALRKDFASEMAAQQSELANQMTALRTDVANEMAALRKDFASERELLRKEISLRIALGFTGATTLILAAIGAATSIIVALT